MFLAMSQPKIAQFHSVKSHWKLKGHFLAYASCASIREFTVDHVDRIDLIDQVNRLDQAERINIIDQCL